MALIITICSVILAAAITLLATIGLPGKVDCSAEVIYGNSYDCQAKAFLSDVRFEYTPVNAENWSENKPYLPGSYSVRAVGLSVFDKDRYGKPTPFEILPLPLQVRIGETSLVFGETPTFLSDTTKYDDRISCDGFVYADISAASTAVMPDVSKIQVVDTSGNNVTYAYSFEAVPVTVTFEKRPLKVLVSSTSKVYDGTALTFDQYQLAEGYTLGPDDAITAVFSASQTDAGSTENTPSITIHHLQNGVAIDVTGQYDLEVVPGRLTVDPIPLFITAGNLETTYTGQPISFPEYTVTNSADLLPGHTLQPIFEDPFTNCGTHTYAIAFQIFDAQGRDVTHNYSLNVQTGTIVIKPHALTVRTESASWVYDGELHSHTKYTVEGLLDGHHATEARVPGGVPSIVDAGTKENRIQLTILDKNGNDVTANYAFTYECGTLEVTKRPVTVTTFDQSKVYDSTPLYTGNYVVTNVAPGESYDVETKTQLTDAGTKTNYLILWFYRGNQANQGATITTGNYEITYVYGTLEVTPRPITITTYNSSWIYDGEEHSHIEFTAENLVGGHKVDATNWATITNVGKAENSCTVTIHGYKATTDLNPVDREMGDLTANYTITYKFGTLEVTPRPITIGVVDEEKVYDGKPLQAKEAFVTVDSPYPLVDGHSITATVSGSRITVGTSESKVVKAQIFSGETDVTSNYEITTTKGKLTVHPEGDGGGGGGGGGDGEHEIPEESKIGLPEGFDLNGPPVGQVKDDQDAIIYLRQYSWGDYTGNSWSKATPYNKTLPNSLSYNYLSSIALLNSGGYIHIAQFQDMKAFMLPYYMSLEGEYEKPASDILYSGGSTAFSMVYYSLPSVEDGFDYLKGHLGEYATYEKEYRKYVYKTYLTVDSETRAYMQGIIDKEGFSLSDPSVILKIARYIQHSASYSLDYDRAMDEEKNVVIAFLDQYKVGICQHYAGAATLLYRTLGIPARYVEGFMVQTQKDTFVDIGPMGHAWVEVYIDGVGWIQVEATGGNLNNLSSGGHGAPASINIKPTYTYKSYDGAYLYPQQIVDADSTLSALLKQGYSYDVKITGKQLNPGQSKSVIEKFVLYDPNGEDVTEDYDIHYEEGLLEVFQASIQFIRVYLYQLQQYYDGSTLAFGADDYEIIEMPKGIELKLSLNISMTEPGSLSLAEINAELEKYATYTVYKNGRNVTSQYQLIFDTFDDPDPAYVPIRVDMRPIEITSASQSKAYDGEILTNEGVFISRGSLVAGHKLVAKAHGQISSVGSAANTLQLEDIQILDRNGKDVTAYYNISIVEGILTITPEPL